MDTSAKRNYAIFAVMAGLAVVLSILAHLEPRFPGDLQATLVFQSVHSDAVLAAMKGVSYAVAEWRTYVIVAVAAAISWWRLGGLTAGIVVLSGLTTLLNGALKSLVDRPRPTPDLVTVFAHEPTRSFPSGHAFFAVAALGMLAYLAVIHQTRRSMKAATLAVYVILAVWIGAARIYLGVHWASDVVGGYLVGGLFLATEIRLYQTLRSRRKKPGAGLTPAPPMINNR